MITPPFRTGARGSVDRLRRGIDDLFGLFVLPPLVALLPWRIAWPALKWLARHSVTFRAESATAWQVAVRYLDLPGDGVARRDWEQRHRLVRWTERVDTYATLIRSRVWWERHIDIIGALPPASAPGVLLNCHWGAGNWLWNVLRANGIAAYFLAQRPHALDYGRGRVALWYGHFRAWVLGRIGSLGPIYTGGSSQHLADAWAGGHFVVGMLDLPARTQRESRQVRLLDRPARLPSGLAAAALRANVSVSMLSCGLDFASGRRVLRIEQMDAAQDVASVLDRYAVHLDGCLRRSPEAWHMWHEAPAIFVAPPGTGARNDDES